MPSLAEIKQKRLKKFIKKPYRAWNLTGEQIEHVQKISSDSLAGNKIVNPIPYKNSAIDPPTTDNQDNNQITTKKQPGNKVTTKEQPDNNKITIRQQQKSNQETTRKQPSNNETTSKQQREIYPDIKQSNNEITDTQQYNEEKCLFSVQNLVGLQKKLFEYIFNLCLARDATNTGHISTLDVSVSLGCSCGTTKVMLSRLEKKLLIRRLKGKGCRGGFINFEIPKNIKIIALKISKELVSHQGNNEATSRQQRNNNRDIEQDNCSYSSSSSIYKNTTNYAHMLLAKEWQNIDIDPLSKIGFSTTHLSQIMSQNKLSAEIVQDSIYAFAFDLQENNKSKSIKGDPINFFMGILRNGKPYLPPSNYESPQDKAMRLYLESRKGREQKEQEVIDFAFTDWFAQLANEEKVEFLPEELRKSAGAALDPRLTKAAMQHFKMAIWPSKREEIFGKTNGKKVEEVNGE